MSSKHSTPDGNDSPQHPFDPVKDAILDDDPDQSLEDAVAEFINTEYYRADIFPGSAFIHVEFPNPYHASAEPPVAAQFAILDDGTRCRNGMVTIDFIDEYGQPHTSSVEVYADDGLYSAIRAVKYPSSE